MWPRPAVALVAGALLLLAPAAAAQEVEGAEVAVRLEDQRIYESSGLALSRRHRAVLWTHNDSGGDPALYAVGPDGRTVATLTLAGAEARDWEAMAAGRDDRGRPALFVGDIGDNNGVWPEVAVYRVAEPAELRDATVPAARYRLRYADGPHDAEALLVDPRSNRLYVATKEVAGGGLYRAPARLRSGQVNVPCPSVRQHSCRPGKRRQHEPVPARQHLVIASRPHASRSARRAPTRSRG